MRAAALHDDELAVAIAARNERRRRGISELLRRLGDSARPIVPRNEVANVIYVLLSFETFDALATENRTPDDVVPVVRRLIRGVLSLPAA